FIAISRSGPLGGLGLLFTPGAMVTAQALLISPVITGLSISALSGVRPEIKDTALSLGASRVQIAITMLREVRYAMAVVVLAGFGRAISEVGAGIMVGGNIRGYTRTLTTAMSLETSMGNIEFSMALGIILITIALFVSIIVYRLQRL
ncbi:MAG: ABC transporter permease, partial [Dehalococcoidia bacterium]|nr:ABC transporter permease [Dehalococcoidia bacterium]